MNRSLCHVSIWPFTGTFAIAVGSIVAGCGTHDAPPPSKPDSSASTGGAQGQAGSTGSGGGSVTGSGGGSTDAVGGTPAAVAGTGGDTPSSGGAADVGTGGTDTAPSTGGTPTSSNDDDDDDDDDVLTGNAGAGGVTSAVEDPAAALQGDITFSAPNGTFEGTLSVELGTGLQDAEIHYTTDGLPPTVDSPVYSGSPVEVSETTQIRAQAFVDGAVAGLPGTAVYVARSFDVDLDLPIVVLDDYGAGLPEDDTDRNWYDSALLVFNLDGGGASLSDTPAIASRAAIHLRGQSSSTFEKAPYRLEIRGNSDEDADYPLLGMPADADWVMRGPYPDKSLIRDPLVYGLGRDMGLVSPRWAFCELYRNAEARPLSPDDYMGVYVIVETLKNSKNRINLKQLHADDPADLVEPNVTGGYIFKFEWKVAEEPLITCTGDSATCWRDLEAADPSPIAPEQQAWLTTRIQTFHDLLHADNYADPTTGYAGMIDVASWVDHFIIQELTRNLDGYLKSAYFHDDRGGLIKAGPLWDYDLSFGIGSKTTYENFSVDAWQYEIQRPQMSNDWFPRLVTDPAFMDHVAQRWRELRQGLLSDAQLSARIDTLSAPLVNAAVRNFERWPNLEDVKVSFADTAVTTTWEEQVQYLRDWLAQRIAWLDTQWG